MTDLETDSTRSPHTEFSHLPFHCLQSASEITCIPTYWCIPRQSTTDSFSLSYSSSYSLLQAVSLQFLDLSQIPLDKKSVEYIVASLTQPPSPGLASLRLDDCSLKPGALDVLGQ